VLASGVGERAKHQTTHNERRPYFAPCDAQVGASLHNDIVKKHTDISLIAIPCVNLSKLSSTHNTAKLVENDLIAYRLHAQCHFLHNQHRYRRLTR
jgi:hypothetical protein